MSAEAVPAVAGLDVGAEYVKAVVLGPDRRVIGRATVPARGYFRDCAYEALGIALDDAQRAEGDLSAIGATGFGAECVPNATRHAGDAAAHAAGVFHHLGHPMTLLVLGGHEPQVIAVDGDGRHNGARGVRRCAVGVGSFLIYTARHLDVHPARLQELAAGAARAAPVSSYCSVFSSTGILEQLRAGATREAVALGAMRSIAERLIEVGGLEPPLVATGGVAEYFPGVLSELEALTGLAVRTAPEPIFTAALGAALTAWPS